VALNTSDIPLPTNFPRAEDVLKNNAPFDVGLLPLRDPDHFVSGQIHNYLDEWKFILEKDINDDKTCVLDWLEHGVDSILKVDTLTPIYLISSIFRTRPVVQSMQILFLESYASEFLQGVLNYLE
jgi:hypothetical protein